MAEKKAKQKQVSEAEAVAIIAGALAIGAGIKATATTLSSTLAVPVPILLPILLIAMSRPVRYGGVVTLASASASAESSRLEATYRAHYIWAASQRVQQALREGVSLKDALAPEQGYFNQHMDAASNRRRAATAVDKAAAQFGDLLGWYAMLDDRTSPECREAHGKNFSANRLPAIGWPGSVHPNCRCKPGKRHATSATVYSIQPDARKAS